MIDILLRWMLTEFLLSGLLFFLWKGIAATKMRSADRYLFLKISFLLLLILPWMQGFFATLPTGPSLDGALLDASQSIQVNSQMISVNTQIENWNWIPAIRISFVVLYLVVLLIQLGRVFASYLHVREITKKAEFFCFSSTSQAKIFMHNQNIPPATYGFFQPIILLPKTLLQRPEFDLNMVLRHEELHIKNLDYLFNLLKLFVHIVLVFSPFVFYLTKRFEEEMELSCDESVLRDTQISPKKYGTLLLDLATMGAPCHKTLHSGLFISNSFISRRIRVMKTERMFARPMRSMLFAVAFALLAGPILWATQGRSNQDAGVITTSGIVFKYTLQTKQKDGQSKREQKLEGTMVIPNLQSRKIAGDGIYLQVVPTRLGDSVKFDAALFDGNNKQIYAGAVIVQIGTDGGIEGRLEEAPYMTEFSFVVELKSVSE